MLKQLLGMRRQNIECVPGLERDRLDLPSCGHEEAVSVAVEHNRHLEDALVFLPVGRCWMSEMYRLEVFAARQHQLCHACHLRQRCFADLMCVVWTESCVDEPRPSVR